MSPLLGPALLSVVLQLQAPGLLPIQCRPGHFPDRPSRSCPGAPHDFICLGGSEFRPASRLCPPAKPLYAPFRRASPGGFGRVPAAYCPALRSSRSFSSCKRRASSRYSAARAISQTGPPGPVRGPRMISPAWAKVNSARHQDFALRPNPCTRLPGAPRLRLGRVPAAYCPAPRSSRSFSSCKRRASSRYSAARAISQTGPAAPVRGAPHGFHLPGRK